MSSIIGRNWADVEDDEVEITLIDMRRRKHTTSIVYSTRELYVAIIPMQGKWKAFDYDNNVGYLPSGAVGGWREIQLKQKTDVHSAPRLDTKNAFDDLDSEE